MCDADPFYVCDFSGVDLASKCTATFVVVAESTETSRLAIETARMVMMIRALAKEYRDRGGIGRRWYSPSIFHLIILFLFEAKEQEYYSYHARI